jgi:hypothetical protein
MPSDAGQNHHVAHIAEAADMALNGVEQVVELVISRPVSSGRSRCR